MFFTIKFCQNVKALILVYKINNIVNQAFTNILTVYIQYVNIYVEKKEYERICVQRERPD